MATLLLIRGNSGSGKTTLAKAIQAQYGSQCLLLSQDMIRRDILREFGQSGTLTISLVAEMARFGYHHEMLVILEGFYEKERYGTMLTDLKALFGNRVLAYYYDLPFEETVRRHQTRDKRHEFTPDDMKRWWKDKDYLGWSEEVILGPQECLESLVNRTLERLAVMTGSR